MDVLDQFEVFSEAEEGLRSEFAIHEGRQVALDLRVDLPVGVEVVRGLGDIPAVLEVRQGGFPD